VDGGFVLGPTQQTLAPLASTRLFIAGRAEPGSRRTHKRLARYRTGCEGRISYLKRGYGLRRSQLKGKQGQRIWTGWAILTYDLDTLAIHTG
jgi:transposase, IS5 family